VSNKHCNTVAKHLGNVLLETELFANYLTLCKFTIDIDLLNILCATQFMTSSTTVNFINQIRACFPFPPFRLIKFTPRSSFRPIRLRPWRYINVFTYLLTYRHSCKKILAPQLISFLGDFNYDFVTYTHFTRVAAARTTIDDVTN